MPSHSLCLGEICTSIENCFRAHSQHDADALNPKLAGFGATHLDVPFLLHKLRILILNKYSYKYENVNKYKN